MHAAVCSARLSLASKLTRRPQARHGREHVCVGSCARCLCTLSSQPCYEKKIRPMALCVTCALVCERLRCEPCSQASDHSHLEHLECSPQPHIQGRGAKKLAFNLIQRGKAEIVAEISKPLGRVAGPRGASDCSSARTHSARPAKPVHSQPDVGSFWRASSLGAAAAAVVLIFLTCSQLLDAKAD